MILCSTVAIPRLLTHADDRAPYQRRATLPSSPNRYHFSIPNHIVGTDVSSVFVFEHVIGIGIEGNTLRTSMNLCSEFVRKVCVLRMAMRLGNLPGLTLDVKESDGSCGTSAQNNDVSLTVLYGTG